MLKNNRKACGSGITKAILTASQMGGTALFGISSGQANAACIDGVGGDDPWATVFSTTTPYSCRVGDKTFSEFSTNISAEGTDRVEFGSNNNVWDVNANFDPARNLVAQDYYQYQASIDTVNYPDTYFDEVFLSWITNPPSVAGVSKEIYDTATNTLLGTLTSNNIPSFVLPGEYTSLTVRNTITSGGNYDNISNNYIQRSHAEAPGPLPLLGAGAAFGFSRRLRSRIRNPRLRISGLAKS